MLFIGLNPSLANSSKDDPTLRRLLGFCYSWGYGNLLVINLFALISESPQVLGKSKNPIGDFNDEQLLKRVLHWSRCPDWDLWCGWGCGGSLHKRENEVIALLEKAFIIRLQQLPEAQGPLAIGFTQRGQPCHPLYVSNKQFLRPFDWTNLYFNKTLPLNQVKKARDG